MWIYFQRSGKLYHDDDPVCAGYSGFGTSKNQPQDEPLPGLGPLPHGAYTIGAVRDHDPPHGPVVLPLEPLPPTQTYGRSGFLIHGDSIESPGSASHGCIILPRPVRERIAGSTDRLLVVLSGNV